MTLNPTEIASTIEKEAKEKYDNQMLSTYLQSYNLDVFMEIVKFFGEQDEEHPHLEAYEVYQLVEENLPSQNPGKEEIQKTLEALLNVDGGA